MGFGKEEFEVHKKLNIFSDYLKITLESNKESISFADVNINLLSGNWMNSRYVKPTYCHHQYLEYSSSHTKHTTHSISCNQSLRTRRLCSLKSGFLEDLTKTKSRFLKISYWRTYLTKS